MYPKLLHLYQNHHLDSTRWQSFQPRAGDIVISTSIKSGTTLTQEIVANLVFLNQDPALWHQVSASRISPWLDSRVTPLDEVISQLEAQENRRFIKSHLALDGLPYYPDLKYIVVARDARDVFMSLWNHYSNYTPAAYAKYNDTPARVGAPFPICPDDIHEVWHNWIMRGWFEWESEGYPYWGNMHHSQSWWDYRHLNNIHLAHYSDLVGDPSGEVRRMANFLEIAITGAQIDNILPRLSIDAMRKFEAEAGNFQSFQGGAETFFFKGTNGRWKEFLSQEELALYDETATRLLTPECRQWLECGRAALA